MSSQSQRQIRKSFGLAGNRANNTNVSKILVLFGNPKEELKKKEFSGPYDNKYIGLLSATLRAADVSILPRTVTQNMNPHTIMIVKKASDMKVDC
ncbi:hypothetical protein E2986_12071 [Frieseomelitta varia]|uniref:Uncharacterized protein n=1 Tax=Frieseomelitta varia TaxID=561572 RepID=A0A833SKU1_9HYME|nr:hypothetical protein E2986_12071 [Frieseomelitta varia]